MTAAVLPGLVAQIKADFAHHGREMDELCNPSKPEPSSSTRISEFQARSTLRRGPDALQLRPGDGAIPDITSAEQAIETAWSQVAAKYLKGLGVCFGIRSMLSVMAADRAWPPRVAETATQRLPISTPKSTSAGFANKRVIRVVSPV